MSAGAGVPSTPRSPRSTAGNMPLRAIACTLRAEVAMYAFRRPRDEATPEAHAHSAISLPPKNSDGMANEPSAQLAQGAAVGPLPPATPATPPFRSKAESNSTQLTRIGMAVAPNMASRENISARGIVCFAWPTSPDTNETDSNPDTDHKQTASISGMSWWYVPLPPALAGQPPPPPPSGADTTEAVRTRAMDAHDDKGVKQATSSMCANGQNEKTAMITAARAASVSPFRLRMAVPPTSPHMARVRAQNGGGTVLAAAAALASAAAVTRSLLAPLAMMAAAVHRRLPNQ